MAGVRGKAGHASRRKVKVTKGDRRERLCLKCETAFMSEWSGHRICDKCKYKTDHGRCTGILREEWTEDEGYMTPMLSSTGRIMPIRVRE